MQSGLSDAGSLQNLNPLVLPDSVGWLPLAPGLKVIALLLILGIICLAWRALLNWRADRYRREAARELNSMSGTDGIPSLLKRTALSLYDRDQVASLDGDDWYRFLDESGGMSEFNSGCGALMARLSYGGDSLDQDEAARLKAAAKQWIRQHGAQG